MNMDNNILIVKNSGRFLFLDWNRIDFIQAEGNYVRIHCADHTTHLIRETLGDISNRLGNPPFVRISRSTIINIHCIRELRNRRSQSIEVLLTNNKTCYWSRSYKPSLNALLGRAANG